MAREMTAEEELQNAALAAEQGDFDEMRQLAAELDALRAVAEAANNVVENLAAGDTGKLTRDQLISKVDVAKRMLWAALDRAREAGR